MLERAPEDPLGQLETLDDRACDLHAIAEDKQGTMFRLRAEIGGEPIDLVLPSPDAQRNALLAWVVERCAARA